ncbi:MAG: hypothetical protein ACOCWR_06780, partial [Oceanidesulfovibrio sp.]
MPRYQVTFVTKLVDKDKKESRTLRDTMEMEAIGERVAALKVANTVHGTPDKLQFYPQFLDSG